MAWEFFVAAFWRPGRSNSTENIETQAAVPYIEAIQYGDAVKLL
jgi:hypothetical protein